jgi:hypothetical protein
LDVKPSAQKHANENLQNAEDYLLFCEIQPSQRRFLNRGFRLHVEKSETEPSKESRTRTGLNAQRRWKDMHIKIMAGILRPAEEFAVQVDDERRLGVQADLPTATRLDRGMIGWQIAGDHAGEIANQFPAPQPPHMEIIKEPIIDHGVGSEDKIAFATADGHT